MAGAGRGGGALRSPRRASMNSSSEVWRDPSLILPHKGGGDRLRPIALPVTLEDNTKLNSAAQEERAIRDRGDELGDCRPPPARRSGAHRQLEEPRGAPFGPEPPVWHKRCSAGARWSGPAGRPERATADCLQSAPGGRPSNLRDDTLPPPEGRPDEGEACRSVAARETTRARAVRQHEGTRSNLRHSPTSPTRAWKNIRNMVK